MTTLGTATLHTALDAGGLTAGLRTAQAQTQQQMGQISASIAESTRRMGDQLSGIGGKLSTHLSLPLAAVGAAAARSALLLGNTADRLLDLADMTGLSTDRLQEFEGVARVAGVPTEALANAAMGLTRQLRVGGEEGARFADAAAAIGVNVRDAGGNLRNMDALMPELIARLQGMESIIDRNAAAFALFGRGAQEILPVLGMTTAEFEAAATQAREMGQVMGRDALQAANAFRIEYEQLRAELGLAGREITQSLLPAFRGLLTTLRTDIIPIIRSAAEAFAGMSDAQRAFLLAAVGFGAAIGPLLVALGQITTAIGAVTAALSKLKVAKLAFLGPAGVLALVAAGFYALYDAMDAGAESRRAAQESFDGLLANMQQYRQELAITSEAERQAAIETIERQRHVLQRGIEVTQGMIRAIEAEVIAFGQAGLLAQIFGFMPANVNLRALEQWEQQLGRLRQEMAGLDAETARILAQPLQVPAAAPPGVRPPVAPGAAPDAIAELAATQRTAQAIFADLAREGYAAVQLAEAHGNTAERLAQSARARIGLVDRAMRELTELGFAPASAEVQYLAGRYQALTTELGKLEAAIRAVADAEREATEERRIPTPDITIDIAARRPIPAPSVAVDIEFTGRSILAIQQEIARAWDVYRWAGTQAGRDAAALLAWGLEQELKRIQDRLETDLRITPIVEVAALREIPIPEVRVVLPPLRDIPIPTIEIDVDTRGSLAHLRQLSWFAKQQFEAALTEAGREAAYALMRDYTAQIEAIEGRFREIEIPVPEITVEVDLDTVRMQRQLEETFANAAVSLSRSLVDAIREGDVSRAIESVFQIGAGLLATPAILGGPLGILLGGGLGIIGSLLGGLFGGREQQARQAEREAAQQARGAPAISISAVVHQTNQFQAGVTDPAVKATLDQRTRQIIAEILTQLGVGDMLARARGGAVA